MDCSKKTKRITFTSDNNSKLGHLR